MEEKRKNTNKLAVISGAWYIVGNFLVKGMAFLTTPIFTRIMSKDEFGDYSNYLSWSGIVLIVLTMSIDTSLISAKFDYEKKLSQYTLSTLSLILLLSFLWLAVVNIFSVFFTELMGLSIAYINIILIYGFFYLCVNFFQNTERYLYRYKRAVVISLFLVFSTSLLSVLLVLNMSNHVTARVIGGVIPTIIVGVIIFGYYIKKGQSVDFKTWPYALKICLPYIPHLLSLLLLCSVDRIMITRFCGPAETAMYSVAFTCGHMASLLFSSMNNAYAPWLGDKLNEKDYNAIRTTSIFYVSLSCFVMIPMMLFAPEILLLLGGVAYVEAKYVMIPIALGTMCQFVYTLYVNIEQYHKNTVNMAFASVISAIINYFLNLWFIPLYGYVAAGYTTFLSYFVLLLIHMSIVKKMGYGKCYHNYFNLGIIFANCFIFIGIYFLYSNNAYRFSVTILFVIIISLYSWRYKTKIYSLYKELVK